MNQSKKSRWFLKPLHWLFRPLCYGGLITAVIFFTFTFTPSLIPRSWGLQGLLAGLTAAIGYGLGVYISKFIRHFFLKSEPKSSTKHKCWKALFILGPVLMIISVFAGEHWDKQLRELMSMDLKEPWQIISMVLLSIIFALVMIFVGRIVTGFFHVLAHIAKKSCLTGLQN